jgi:hypothetical protein
MKTAVEYLEGYITSDGGFDLKAVIQQAKEMEKNQIIKAVYDSMGTNLDPNIGRAEQYYNETFKSE